MSLFRKRAGLALGALLVTAVGITERLVNRRMGARPA